MIRRLPNLRGKLDAATENEIIAAFNSLYDVVELLAKSVGSSLEPNQNSTPSTLQRFTQSTQDSKQQDSVGLQSGVFSQAQVGQIADPNLRPNIPANYLFSNMTNVVGAVPVGGKVAISDGLGHTFNFLVE